MRCLTIDVTLEEPVLCTQLDGEPNSARTFGFVPGSVLRGALAAAFAVEKGLTEDGALLGDDDARVAFFGADVRYLNAYPLVGGVRALPASQAWFRDKHKQRAVGHEAPIYDVFVAPTSDANKRIAGDDDTFAVRSGDEVRLHTAKRQVAIHTMRDRVAGRARTDSGAVFRYEALAPRQTLRAHVLVSERGAEILKNLLGDGAAIALGKSRTAGYGRAQAKCVSDAASLDGWNELGDPVASAAADGKWRLTLLSDALLRDAGGRQSASGDAVKAALADALGVAVDKIVVTPRYVTVRTVGGFNRTWGLPLAQATAARMGSEYEVESDALTAEQARQLEQHGIGERRADGFGRIALRPAGGAATLAETKGGEAASSKKTLAVDAPGRKTAEVMLERMLRHMLDRKVTEKALQISEYVKRPTVSQLKRLQAIVRNELTEVVRANGESVKVAKAGESTVRLKNYMTHLGQRPSIKRLFDAGRLPTVVKSGASTASLNEWLDHRFSENDDEIDTLLGMKDEKLPEIGGVQAKMTTHLRREYSLRLVHAVLGLAAKNKRRSGEERR